MSMMSKLLHQKEKGNRCLLCLWRLSLARIQYKFPHKSYHDVRPKLGDACVGI